MVVTNETEQGRQYKEGSLGAACFFVVILSLNRKPRLQ